MTVIGSLLVLSACGTPAGPPAAGNYVATFLVSETTNHSIRSVNSFPLTMSGNGTFVLTLDFHGHTVNGHWTEHGNSVMLKGTDGRAHFVLHFRRFGKNLGNSGSHMGILEYLGKYTIPELPSAPWNAVRI